MDAQEYAGGKVRAVREARGMSQALLGALLGEQLGAPWPRQTVHQAEAGKRKLGVVELVAIAAVLDVHPAEFLPANAQAVAVALDDLRAVRVGRAVLAALEGLERP